MTQTLWTDGRLELDKGLRQRIVKAANFHIGNHPKCAELDRASERYHGRISWSVTSEDRNSNLDILQ